MLGCAVNNLGKVIDLDQLFRDVVQALTGRADVVLKFEPSPSRGAMGSLTIDPAGTPVVFVDPGMDFETVYTTFIHECAHIVLHAGTLARSTASTAPAGSIVNQDRIDRPAAHLAQEDAAHDLQKRWLDHAAANAWRVVDQNWTLAGFHPAIYKLLVLKELGK